MASAAEVHAHANGYSLMLYNTHDDVEREASYIAIAGERWVDGVLFVAAEDRLDGLAALHSAGIPSVAIDRIPQGYAGPSVTIDNIPPAVSPPSTCSNSATPALPTSAARFTCASPANARRASDPSLPGCPRAWSPAPKATGRAPPATLPCSRSSDRGRPPAGLRR